MGHFVPASLSCHLEFVLERMSFPFHFLCLTHFFFFLWFFNDEFEVFEKRTLLKKLRATFLAAFCRRL